MKLSKNEIIINIAAIQLIVLLLENYFMEIMHLEYS